MTCYLFDHIVKPFYYAFLLLIVRVFLTPPLLTSPPLSWHQGKKHLFSQTLLVVIEEWHFELLYFEKAVQNVIPQSPQAVFGEIDAFE